jgi:GNAT superfamily N-acetyltransferase
MSLWPEICGMSKSPVVRPAEPVDIPVIHRLCHGLAEYENLLHKFTATEADLHALLFGPVPRCHALLVEMSTQPDEGSEHTVQAVGIAIYYFTSSTFSGRTGIFLEDLFVDPKYRGHGLGLALMRRLADIAVAENCTGITWWVLNWNQPSIDFYERLGATRMTDWQVRQLDGDALSALAKGSPNG